MPTTTRGYPYPSTSDDPDVPADMQALAEAIDTDVATRTASTLAVNAQTGTTYTLVASDAVSKIVTLNNAAAVTVTVPSGTFAQGHHVPVLNKGAGTVTLVGSGVTLNGASLTLAQNESATLVFDSATVAYVVKGGGGLPKASVSGTTGSPTTGSYTSGGTTYDYWRWTATGSVTFNHAGTALVEVLLVAGGGGGDNTFDGGGGGDAKQVFLPVTATSYTITIGAGGAGANGAAASPGSASSFGSLLRVGGGLGARNSAVNGGQPVGAMGGAAGSNNSGGGATGAASGVTPGAGLTTTISDGSTSVEYGKGGASGSTSNGTANRGEGGGGGQITSGGSGYCVMRIAR